MADYHVIRISRIMWIQVTRVAGLVGLDPGEFARAAIARELTSVTVVLHSWK